MRDYENPVHIPPLALKILTLGLVVFLVITPVVVVIKSGGDQNPLVLAAWGLAGVAFILGGMFIQRLIVWFVYTFYWYIAACGGIALFFFSLAVIGNIATLPTVPNTNQASPLTNTILIGGTFLGTMALYLVFRPTRAKNPQTQLPISPAPTPKTPKQKVILDTAQQIAARKKGLGLDDDGEK